MRPASIDIDSVAHCTTTIHLEFPLHNPSYEGRYDDDEGTGDEEGLNAFRHGLEIALPQFTTLGTLMFRFLHHTNQNALEYLAARQQFLPASLTHLRMFATELECYKCEWRVAGDTDSTVSAHCIWWVLLMFPCTV